MAPISAEGSSTSPTTPTSSSPPSDREPSRSVWSGSGWLGRRALLDLARRHGLTPRKSLGQHFLADPNVARAIARDVGAAPGERVLEVGAGLGSLTVALARAGAEVLALETDRRVIDALQEVVGPWPAVRVIHADATEANWAVILGDGPWRMASNLPYQVAVSIVLDLLERAPEVDPFVVMVQREVGERLAAGPGEPSYGAVSLKVAYRSTVRMIRRVAPSVFWPKPNVESVVVRLDRRPPPVTTPGPVLFGLVEEGFRQRRKTLAAALVRLGHDRDQARTAIDRAGFDPQVRAEALGLEDFARVAEALGA